MDEHPDSKIISLLGGPAKVGQLCKVSPQAVSQWRRAGIPEARRMYLALLNPAAFEGDPIAGKPPCASVVFKAAESAHGF